MKDRIGGAMEYVIVKEIAKGGMGAVYLAKLQGVAGFEKVVAIKTLLEKFSQDEAFVERFIAEAKLVANLVHENIVQIYQLERTGDVYYFVLEFVDGIALYQLMEFHRVLRRRMPVPLAVFVVSRIARGLSYAHSRTDGEGKPLNIVHCDVCLHNIMINSEGVPKLTDFGIARATNIKEIGSVSGKLAFMAPEQAHRDGVIDFRTDIYSLGVVLFYLLTGTYSRNLDKPVGEMLEDIRNGVVNWSELPADLDPALVAILKRMLANKPQDRYQCSDDMARELEYFIYKDGYGPTIVALAKYLRELMPGRFVTGTSSTDNVTGATASDYPEETDRTVVMADDVERTVVLDDLDKTIKLSAEDLERIHEGKK